MSSVPAATLPAGAFLVTWTAGRQLQITHQANSGRVLWSSLPGCGFVAAALGDAKVQQHHGHFAIRDRFELLCDRQTVDELSSAENRVTISGCLSAGRPRATTRYQLTFRSVGLNQLEFGFSLSSDRFNRTRLTFQSSRDERFFGFGEQFSHFDLKGRRLPIWVAEQGVGRGAQPVTLAANLTMKAGGKWHSSYAAVPHTITSHLRSLFLTSYEYCVFDMRRDHRVQVHLHANCMTGRILYGESPAQLIREYTQVAGRMRPLPDWILEGAVVGIQGGTERVRQVWRQLAAHGTPVAGFWLQDWVGQRVTNFGKQLWWNWELDQRQYAGWDALVADLAAKRIKVLTYFNPALVDVTDKPHYRRNLFREAADRDYLVRNRSGKVELVQMTSFSAGLVDLTNPAACEWYKEIIREQVLVTRASGWMADYGEYLPYRACLASGISAASFHNQYPEAWARLNREVLESCDHHDQLLFFVRSGYRNSPGAATLFWLGDQLVSWDAHDGIRTAVTGLLSSGLSGFSLNHSDLGGFTTISSPVLNYHRTKELLWRWMELAAFTTVFRTHEGNIPGANHQIYTDDATLAQFGRLAKLYRAWAFYRKTLVREAHQTGLPVVRHLFIHYPSDPHVLRISYQQFLVGTEFLVAPVLEPGARTVAVYLPAGDRWTHLWTGRTYDTIEKGIRIAVLAPLGQPGVFCRQGSAVAEQFLANLRADGLLDGTSPEIPRATAWE